MVQQVNLPFCEKSIKGENRSVTCSMSRLLLLLGTTVMVFPQIRRTRTIQTRYISTVYIYSTWIYTHTYIYCLYRYDQFYHFHLYLYLHSTYFNPHIFFQDGHNQIWETTSFAPFCNPTTFNLVIQGKLTSLTTLPISLKSYHLSNHFLLFLISSALPFSSNGEILRSLFHEFLGSFIFGIIMVLERQDKEGNTSSHLDRDYQNYITMLLQVKRNNQQQILNYVTYFNISIIQSAV